MIFHVQNKPILKSISRHSYIWQSLLRLAHTNKPDFSTKKLLRSYPKRQEFLVIFWNNLVPSYMQGIKVIAKCNYDPFESNSRHFICTRNEFIVQTIMELV